MKRVCIRADASLSIGAGHIGRCVALADALRAHGVETVFASRPLAGNAAAAVRRHGHAQVWVTPSGVVDGPEPTPARADEPFAWDADAAAMQAWLARQPRCDWLVADHYGIDERWETRLRPLAGGVMCVDDLADRRHDCDVLLDQNVLGEDRYAPLTPEACRRLLGPRWALLRPQFRAARGTLAPRDGRVRRLLVSYGQHDLAGATEIALAALDDLGWPCASVDVVAGGPRERRAEVARRCAAHPGTTCSSDVEEMATLMAGADLALGAAGITTWERCCLRLPALVTTVAANQRGVVAAAGAAGAIVDLGPVEESRPAAVAASLTALLADAARVRAMGAAAGALCDGLGAWRVAETLGADDRRGLLLRRADAADVLLYHEWANDPDVRASSFTSDPIPLESHQRWFAQRLADPVSFLYVLEQEGAPVAQIRFDVVAAGGRVSFSVDRGHRGHGLAAAVLRLGARRLAADAPRVPLVFGLVKQANGASLAAFRRAGFEESRYLGEQRDGSTTFVRRSGDA